MDIEECLREGFLKKSKSREDEIKKELKESARDLEDARESLKMRKYKWAIIQSYYSMFHSARAVVMSLGYRERRHFAIPIVLKELLVDKGKLSSSFVEDFKAAIFAREEADYEANYSEERARDLVEMAKEFSAAMKRYLK